MITEGFESASLVSVLANNRDFLNPFLSLLNKSEDGIQFSINVKKGQLQPNSLRLSSVKVDESYSAQEEATGKSFISSLPRYIKRLFSDRF